MASPGKPSQRPVLVSSTSTDLTAKDDADLALWKRWKKSGSREDFDKLEAAFIGEVDKYLTKFEKAEVDQSALRAYAIDTLHKYFKAYDPSTSLFGAGVSFRVGLLRFLKRVNRMLPIHERRF